MLDKLHKLSLLLAVAIAGALTAVARPQSAAPPAPCDESVVFVSDGAGGRFPCADVLDKLSKEGCPLRVINVPWTHGYKHNLKDQTDCSHSRMEGRRLAQLVLEFRSTNPDCRVCMLGYCAGCGVVLAAAEELPPNTLDDVVLLAPSVSPRYDLRPALRAIRCRLTSFNSRRDFVVLGMVMHCVGTTDRWHWPAAGCVGFRPVLDGSPEDALYAKLRERNWGLADCKLSHFGGHFGYTRECFIHSCVLPVLLGHYQN